LGQQSDSAIEFRRDVLPILSENCFACHGFDEKARQAELRLDTPEGAVKETESGEFAIVPGAPGKSELLARINSDDEDLVMPPPDTEKRLSKKQRELLARWIKQGAEYQKHWSFEAPKAVEPPATPDTAHPIDRFVLARLKKDGLTTSAKASDATLVRRISLDLTGLPPTLEKIDSFLAEGKVDRSGAIESLVNRLLQSPQYGERWARWWLDQARYADSNGYSIDGPRQIWKYRDWVVEAINNDMPFDQFTIEQLAGDLLPGASQSQKVATGFHRNTQINQEGGIDKEQFRVDSVFDRVATTGTVWLGLTIGCAQCHDHKFDPIKQNEYYQLFAFFNNQDEPSMKVYSDAAAVPALKDQIEQAERKLDDFIASNEEKYVAWESKLTAAETNKLPRSVKQALKIETAKRSAKQNRELFNIEVGKIDNEYQALKQAYDKLYGEVHGVATTLVMQERKQARKTTVMIKGDFTRPSEKVSPETPSVLHAFETEREFPTRLDLAHWLTSPRNPLTARVIVNRVWQVYFGRGLVETENDFGTLGAAPSHPELLDWLAIEFQKDWSLKSLHRLIVTSDTYQQSSSRRDKLDAIDPNNFLLGRQTRLRLEAELIRDVCLSVSGLLSKKMGGPPVYPPIPSGVMNLGQVKRKWNVSKGEDRFRRGLYTFVFRATPPPSLNVFDAPDGFSTCTRRSRSNTPLQALTLLNDESFMEFARAIQKRIASEGLETVFRATTGRPVTAEELEVFEELDALSVARVILNLDETVTRN